MANIEIYNDLDAPVFVWEKIHKTNDLSWLLVKSRKIDEKLQAKLDAAWEKMYNEYLEEFGFSDSFRMIKQREIERAVLQCRLIKTDDRSYETEIEIADLEIADLKRGVGGYDLREAKRAIEMNVKFQINMNTTSIRDFYGYLKDLQ